MVLPFLNLESRFAEKYYVLALFCGGEDECDCDKRTRGPPPPAEPSGTEAVSSPSPRELAGTENLQLPSRALGESSGASGGARGGAGTKPVGPWWCYFVKVR